MKEKKTKLSLNTIRLKLKNQTHTGNQLKIETKILISIKKNNSGQNTPLNIYKKCP